MKEEGKRISRRWRTAAVLAMGVAIGTVLIATPAASHIGTVTHLWNNHIKPRADARYTRAVQPVGKTQTGIWGAGNSGTAGDFEQGIAEVTFRPRLPSTIPAANVHYITPGAFTTECPARNQAALGHLCLYESWSSGMTVGSTFAPELGTTTGAGKLGFVTYFQADATSSNAWGTWAVKPAAPVGRVVPRISADVRDENGVPSGR
jgi:hypothetical protein